MVYCGKPSQGCENCRNLHVKCDEKRPSCSRCLRMQRTCSGYRDQLDLMFRHKQVKPQGEIRKSESSSMGNSSSSNFAGSWSLQPPETPNRIPCNVNDRSLTGLRGSIYPSLEDRAICYFYHTTTDSLPDANPARYLHLQLPDLYTRSDPDSALRLATQAISYALSAKSEPSFSQLSRKSYTEAVSAVKEAIGDPVKVKSDQTLYAVLLLSGYETITCNSETLPAWGAHVDGAAALLRIRGTEQLHRPFTRELFLFIRRNIVLSHMQISQPVDEIFKKLGAMASPCENPEDGLISISINIPKIQHLANILLPKERWSTHEYDVVELIQAAKRLDSELSDWARRIPQKWAYATAMNLNSRSDSKLSSSHFIPHQIHRYPDFYTARVWNLYRVSRLIIQSIILRASTWLSISSNYEQDSDEDGRETSRRDLVNDICASVPFLLGYESLQTSPPATGSSQHHHSAPSRNLSRMENGPTQTGRFSLIWPLYIGCSVLSVPEIQRRWMRDQLQRIADFGEPQAKLVSVEESKTLVGGSEKFRFDCV